MDANTQKPQFSTRALFLQVRDELATRISAGAWKAGALLPNELQISAELGVSQGTVRKALDLLEAEKIVIRKQGRGTFVVDHDTDEMAIRFSSFFDDEDQKITGQATWSEVVFDLPSAKECKALAIATDEKIVRVRRVRSHAGDPFLYEDAAIIARHFPGITTDGLGSYRLTALAQRHGVQLSHAKERIEPALCPAEMAPRLRIPEHHPILILRRVAYRLDGAAVEHRVAWGHLRGLQYISVTS